jgi:hypothetical protein
MKTFNIQPPISKDEELPKPMPSMFEVECSMLNAN